MTRALLLLTASGFALGCLGGTHHLPPPVAPTDLGAKQVAAVREYMPDDWVRAPWRRPGELILEWPVKVLVAVDGLACLTTGDVWAVARVGEHRTCPGPWRHPR